MAYQMRRTKSGKKTSTVSHNKAHTRKIGNKRVRVKRSKAIRK